MPIDAKFSPHATQSQSPASAGAEAYAARVEVLYQQTPVAIGGTVLNSGIVALVLQSSAGAVPLAVWLGSMVALSAIRAALWVSYRRRPAARSPKRWARLATMGSGASGALWGIGTGILFPENVFLQAFLAFVIGGMSAAAVAAFSSHFPTLLAFVLAATLPMALRFLLEGTEAYAAMALMIVLFAGAMTIVGCNVSRAIHKQFAMRAELSRRTLDLTAANAQLEREIEERRETEERLVQAQKLEALGQLTGGIAHDFNNLLTVVMGNLERAVPLASQEARLQGFLRAAFAASRHGVNLTKRLLAFARRQRLQPTSVDLDGLIDDFSLLAKQTLGPRVILSVHSTAGLWRVRADRNQLELALLNLAINASDAMPAGGELRLTMQNDGRAEERPAGLMPGDYVVIEMQDTGKGMTPDVLAHVFEPFFTTKEPGKGSGLGLPMVLGFAQQSGGTARIESTPDIGTTVQLWLPRAAAAETPEEAPRRFDATTRAGGARILLCEDDGGVRHLLADVLREAGYVVEETEGPDAALRVLRNERPDLLLSDYAMPHMSGATLVSEARRIWPDLQALLISGHADALAGVGIDDLPLLPKPFAPTDLTRRVAEMLREETA